MGSPKSLKLFRAKIKGGDKMSCQYTNPYNQNTGGYIQTDMNKMQNNTGYMNGQPQQMGQMQSYPRNMQTDAPRGTTPLARSLPRVQGSITAQDMGQAPAITTAPTPFQPGMGVTETPVTVQSPYFTAGFLKNFIGKNVRVEFVLGTAGTTTDRVGTLLEVGASYIVIQPLLTDDLLMCDLYSIRFVTIVL